MPLPVLPSKLVWERVRVEFNYLSELAYNETITTWFVEASAQTGEDPSPENMIATRRFLDGSKTFQWIIGGTPGVVYKLLGTAVSSLGKTYKLERTLAVLPSIQVVPPLFGTTYTSTVYPAELLDTLSDLGLPLPGSYLFELVVDNLNDGVEQLSGSLRLPLIQYSYSEFLDSFTTDLSAILRAHPIYNIPPEFLNSIAGPNNAELKQVVIQYTNYPKEGLDSLPTNLGGTLS